MTESECLKRSLNSRHSQTCHKRCSTCIQCIASDMFLPLPSSLLWTAGKKDGLRQVGIKKNIDHNAKNITSYRSPWLFLHKQINNLRNNQWQKLNNNLSVLQLLCWNKWLQDCFCRACNLIGWEGNAIPERPQSEQDTSSSDRPVFWFILESPRQKSQ